MDFNGICLELLSNYIVCVDVVFYINDAVMFVFMSVLSLLTIEVS